MKHFCRFLYWLLETRGVLFLAENSLRVVRAASNDRFVEGLLGGLQQRFVWSGWPKQLPGWVNLHLSRFVWQLRNRLRGVTDVARAPYDPSRTSRLRVGCIGRFSTLLGFPKELFDAFPRSCDLVIFDIACEGSFAPYLRSVTDEYYQLADSNARTQAKLINAADLDILLNINWRQSAYELLDLVKSPCIMNFCSGADLMHHEKVDVQLYCIPQPDYFLKDQKLFCGTTQQPLDQYFVQWKTSYYDLRHVPLDEQPGWVDREPLITFHGSLYKLASRSYLDCLFEILAADRDLSFVFMGKDNGHALSMIEDTARAWFVADRVHYEGQFSGQRNADGVVSDQGWARMVSYLRRARLACDPWPLGGASSRIEAYALGVPSISVRIRFDPEVWGKRQPVIAEATSLHTALGTVSTIDEYREAAQRCLLEERFAAALVEEQKETARKLADSVVWWRDFFDCFDEWRLRRERTTGLSNNRAAMAQ